jgi:RNA polymerase sigma-70 factor (ECF subfamily)
MSSSASARLLSITAPTKRSSSQDTIAPSSVSLRDLADDVVMSRFQGGELAALEVLYDRYAGLLLGIGRRLLRDATEAEDLVHDVFLYLFRKNHVFEASKGSVRAWLIMVTYSRAFNHRRSLKSRFFNSPQNLPDSQSSLRDNSAVSPEDTEELFHWRAVLLQAFRDLPEEQRQTLHLHFFEGYTLLEISEKLGHSFSNVRHYYYRGIDRLKKRLSGNGISVRGA